VKPLYFAVDGETLYFASEATALHEVRPKELDSAALGDFLAYGYVPGERTIWRGIQKLRPGHLLVFGAQGPIIRRYWSPPTSPDPNTPRAPGVLRQELSNAVEQALISDVPVGAFLSGGLDSATLVALAAQLGPELHSYTIDFDHERTAGAALARQVAERYRTDHHERLLSLDTSLELMRKVVSAYDEPLADESIAPTYVIAGEVARDLKVVLSGDGGDEIFAGYRWYAKLDRLETLRSRLGPLSSPIARLGSRLPESRPPLRRLRRGLRYLGGPTIENYFRLVGYFDRQELRQLIDPAVAGHFADDPLWAYRTHWRPELPLVRRLQTLDLQTYLPDDILTKVDRASMRHSLEARVPYLDHRVVEHALRLPTAAVYASGAGKLILKSVAAELLPEALLAAPKQGFGLQRPVNGDAFLTREAARLEAGTLVRMGLVRPQSLADLLDRRIEGRNPNRIWLLYALDLWLEAHLG
jgi:asparagine synthase (glutamine-hydrolysing)